MNRYILIRRLMGPSILLLLGVTALLNQAHLVSWDLFVPLLLILIGVLKLAERAALASDGYPQPPYSGAPYQGPYQGPNPGQYPGPYPGAVNPQPPGTAPYAQPTGSAIVPAPVNDFDKNRGGGQS